MDNRIRPRALTAFF